MILNQKSFNRRPWSRESHNLIQYFDGIQINDVETKGIYLAMHTAVSFLEQNNIQCDVGPLGFYWPGLTLKNFAVDSVRNGDAVYITDGVIDTLWPNLCIIRGKITNLKNSNAVTLDHLQVGTVTIQDLVASDPIKINNCKIKLLKIVNTTPLNVVLTNSTIESVELWNSPGIALPSGIIPKIYPGTFHEGIKASMAVNITIDGVIYNGVAENVRLSPLK